MFAQFATVAGRRTTVNASWTARYPQRWSCGDSSCPGFKQRIGADGLAERQFLGEPLAVDREVLTTMYALATARRRARIVPRTSRSETLLIPLGSATVRWLTWKRQRLCPLLPQSPNSFVSCSSSTVTVSPEPRAVAPERVRHAAGATRRAIHSAEVLAPSRQFDGPSLRRPAISPHTFSHYAGFRTIPGNEAS